MTNQDLMQGIRGEVHFFPRQSSKYSVQVNTFPAEPKKSTQQMHRLISACAGNHSKRSLQQFVEMYTRHTQREIQIGLTLEEGTNKLFL